MSAVIGEGTVESGAGRSPADIYAVVDDVRLHRLAPTHEDSYSVPVVLVPSLLSKWYVFDLHPARSMLNELLDALTGIETDPSVRAVVLGAEGKSFSTGGDVKAFYAAGEHLAGYAAETVGVLHRVMMTMMRLPQPIVTAVHGMVTGGSLGLLLASDIVLLSPEVTITPWYAVVGFSPDGGWTAILPEVIGRERACGILLHNRSISADEAVAWGIATELAPTDIIGERAAAVAAEVAGMKPGSVASIKRLLRHDHATIEIRLEREREAFVEQIVEPEALKGMAAFLGRPR